MSKKNPLKFKDELELAQYVRDNIKEESKEQFDYYDIYTTTTVSLFGVTIAQVTSTRNYN